MHYMMYLDHSDGSTTYLGHRLDPDAAKSHCRAVVRSRTYGSPGWHVRAVPQILAADVRP